MMNHPKRWRWPSIIKRIIKYLFFLGIGFLIAGIGTFFYFIHDLPRPEKFTESAFIQSTKIFDRTGEVLLYDIYGEEKRTIVPFDKISQNVKNAILASEDSRFYQHIGIDAKGIIRSILIDLRLRSRNQLVGGSTITQQLIRSVYLTKQKTLERKVREIVLSIELERRYEKDQIFDWYLNKIPFGQNAYGVEAASQTYFKKSASELSAAQSALLAALIPAPSYYSPYGSHKDLLFQKKDHILGRMRQLGYLSDEEFNKAKEEEITFAEDAVTIKAPHFVMYVRKYLEDRFGEEFLKEKGLRVYTTLDWKLQEHAENVIKDADETNREFDAHNAALVAIDPKTGEILALVGSKDYFEASYPKGCDTKGSGTCLFDPKFDVATIGLRQPGSAFKPFVYATAFNEGYTPDTILWDVHTEFNPNCPLNGYAPRDIYDQACYHPQNYDGRHRGPVSLRSSLAQSLNIPSVKILYLAGLKDSIKTAQEMGITTLTDPDRYGLSLVLGGGEVNLLEITSAYGVFATEGLRAPSVGILRIEDNQGKILEKNTKEARKVLDTQTAREINSILSDNSARAPVFGIENALSFNEYDVAAKTGTTQYYNDAWTIGYSPFISIGVWVGNNDNSSTNKKTGIGLAAPIWRKMMEEALKSHKKENFTSPEEYSSPNPILLGHLPLEEPPHSILHYIDKNNLEDTSWPHLGDPLYPSWEAGIQKWTNNSAEELLDGENPEDALIDLGEG